MGIFKQALLVTVLAGYLGAPAALASRSRAELISRCSRLLSHAFSDARTYIFELEKIPVKYRLSDDPLAKITLYRGDLRGLETAGIKSNALLDGRVAQVNEVKRLIETGDERAISQLLDRHTSFSHDSALLSTTFSPKQAQAYAKRETETIYKIEVAASRAIVDANNIGRSGKLGEIFVLGEVTPEEIVAIKDRNDVRSSELLNGHLLAIFPEKDDANYSVKDPANWAAPGLLND